MNALLLLSLLFAAVPARAMSAEDSALDRLRSEDYVVRARACADLAHATEHSPRVYPALFLVMDRDISEQVRLAAAKAVMTFPGGDPLTRAQKFLQSEPGEDVRGDMVVFLSTEPSRLDDAGVTGLISTELTDDPSPIVRRVAAIALNHRGDLRAIPAVRRAADGDLDKSVRVAAAEALHTLTTPRLFPKHTMVKFQPKPDAVKGKDSCPEPWSWCECDGPIKRPPKCLTRGDCRVEIDTMIQLGMPCTWNGVSIGAPGDNQ